MFVQKEAELHGLISHFLLYKPNIFAVIDMVTVDIQGQHDVQSDAWFQQRFKTKW